MVPKVSCHLWRCATYGGATYGDSTVLTLGMVHAMDHGIGKVVAALKRFGQYQNTIIIFNTDVHTTVCSISAALMCSSDAHTLRRSMGSNNYFVTE